MQIKYFKQHFLNKHLPMSNKIEQSNHNLSSPWLNIGKKCRVGNQVFLVYSKLKSNMKEDTNISIYLHQLRFSRLIIIVTRFGNSPFICNKLKLMTVI